MLALVAGALIVGFNADVNSLIHLYLLGVFTAFTLSQFGMVRRYFTLRGNAQRARLGRGRAQRHRWCPRPGSSA